MAESNIEREEHRSYTQWRSKSGYDCGGYCGAPGTFFPEGMRCLHWSGATEVSVDKARLFASTLLACCDAIEQEQRERDPREERQAIVTVADEAELVTAPADDVKAALFRIIDENRELRAQIARLSEPAPPGLST